MGSEKKYDEYAIDSVSNVGNQLVVDIYSDDNNQIIRNFDFDRFDENNFEIIKSKYVSSKKFLFGTDIMEEMFLVEFYWALEFHYLLD